MTSPFRTPFAALTLTLAHLLVACGGEDSDASSSSGGATATGGATASTGVGGSGSVSASSSSATAGAGGATSDGYGKITGSCGELDLTDVKDAKPSLLENVIDFSMEGAFDPKELTPEGQAMASKPNLGGSSLLSEVTALEVLHRCDGAKLLKTEAEIVYATEGKKTDFLIELAGAKVGVSVVRAMSYPEGAPYPLDQATGVLSGKLADILKSSANVAKEDAWEKQILAVIAQTPEHAAAIKTAWGKLDAATKADTVVVITETEGVDQFIYYNK